MEENISKQMCLFMEEIGDAIGIRRQGEDQPSKKWYNGYIIGVVLAFEL